MGQRKFVSYSPLANVSGPWLDRACGRAEPIGVRNGSLHVFAVGSKGGSVSDRPGNPRDDAQDHRESGGRDRAPPRSAHTTDDSPWWLGQVFPTSIIGLLGGAALPTADEVLQAFSNYVGEPIGVLQELSPEDDSIEWNRVVSVPGLAAPLIVWGERARAIGPDDLPDRRLSECRWIIGCESLLSAETPLDDYIALVRLLAGSFEEMPAILDGMTRQWFLRPEVEVLFLADEAAATEEVLWRIHAVGRSESPSSDDRVWLYTVGLWRCGKPELEMLEVPGEHLSAAITLLNGTAALAVIGPLPHPDSTAVIGENLRVAFRPWQEVAAFLGPGSVGTLADRAAADEPGAMNPLMGIRAVICDAEEKGTYRKIWSWPEHAIAQLENDRGAIYLSERSTEQLARRARATWPDFATAFAAAERATLEAVQHGEAIVPPTFLVKSPHSSASDPDGAREHLWFEVVRLHGETVEARLINSPQIAKHLAAGSLLSIRRDQVSDWRVLLESGAFGPRLASGLLAAVDQYRAAIRQ